jgi:hypothetical protein
LLGDVFVGACVMVLSLAFALWGSALYDGAKKRREDDQRS